VRRISKHSLSCSVHPANKGYSALFRAVEGEGGEEEEWHLTSVTSFSVQISSLTAIFTPDHWPREQSLIQCD